MKITNLPREIVKRIHSDYKEEELEIVQFIMELIHENDAGYIAMYFLDLASGDREQLKRLCRTIINDKSSPYFWIGVANEYYYDKFICGESIEPPPEYYEANQKYLE